MTVNIAMIIDYMNVAAIHSTSYSIHPIASAMNVTLKTGFFHEIIIFLLF